MGYQGSVRRISDVCLCHDIDLYPINIKRLVRWAFLCDHRTVCSKRTVLWDHDEDAEFIRL